MDDQLSTEENSQRHNGSIRPIKDYIASSKGSLSNVSLSNYYEVYFSGLTENSGISKLVSKKYGVPVDWVINNLGLRCSDASLPTSSFAIGDVKDNFHGINEKFAHTRLYTDTDFSFYLDGDYQALKFFEGWMDYVSGETVNRGGVTNSDGAPLTHNGFFRRFNYPMDPEKGYKISSMYIVKGEKDSNQRERSLITYQFKNVFPRAISSIPVSYGGAEVLKVNVSFAYDRYLILQSKGKQKENNESTQVTVMEGGSTEWDTITQAIKNNNR